MAKLIEKVYGEALLELAVEENRTSEFLEEVQALKQVLLENPDFLKLMLHPAIQKTEKEEILTTVCNGRISKEMTGLMGMLLEKEHFEHLPLVLDYFQEQLKKLEGIGVAYVRSALPLTEEQRKNVEERLLETTSFKSLETYYEVDETMIGGLIIRIGDHIVDNSVKTRLTNLERQLYQV